MLLLSRRCPSPQRRPAVYTWTRSGTKVCTLGENDSRARYRLAEAARVKKRHAVVRHHHIWSVRAVEERLKCLQPTRELLMLLHDGLVALLELLDVFRRLGQDSALSSPSEEPSRDNLFTSTTHLSDFR